MQFSDTSNNTGLLQHCYFLVSADTTKYPAKDVARNINTWYRRVLGWIWRASGGWTFDDIQQSTLPVATTTIVNEQSDYGLPTAAGAGYGEIERVEVKQEGGDYVQIRRITKESMDGSSISATFDSSPGFPQYYYIEGNSLILLPTPSTSVVATTNGLKIYLSRDIVEFSSADTTDEPGFNRNWHHVLAVGAAYDYAMAKLNDNTNLLTTLKGAIDDVKKEIESYYSRREHKDRFQTRRIRRESYC